MDDVRRGEIRVAVGILERLLEQVHGFWLEEEAKFESRSSASRESSTGSFSQEAGARLGNAVEYLQQAIDELKGAVGDDSGGYPP
jgi:hypothetical protein